MRKLCQLKDWITKLGKLLKMHVIYKVTNRNTWNCILQVIYIGLTVVLTGSNTSGSRLRLGRHILGLVDRPMKL